MKEPVMNSFECEGRTMYRLTWFTEKGTCSKTFSTPSECGRFADAMITAQKNKP